MLKAGALRQPRGLGCGGRWEGVQDSRDACAPMADSCQCVAKTTTILYSNYNPIKINFLKARKTLLKS